MDRPVVYTFFDHLRFLAQMTAWMRGRRPGFTLEQLAGAVGLRSKGHMSLVLQGRRRIPEERIPAYGRALGLEVREAEFFAHLVRFGQARTHRDRKRHLDRMVAAMRVADRRLVPSQYALCEAWYHPVVHELLRIHDIVDDWPLLASMLRPSLTPEQARESVALLASIGLVQPDAQGFWKPTEVVVTFGDGWKSVAVREFQRHTFDLAQQALDEVPVAERDISTLTVSLGSSGFSDLRERLSLFRKEVLALARADKAPDRVCQLNLALFPVSRLPTLLAVLLFALAGCGPGGESRGGGIEIPNGLEAWVIDSTGLPVPGAQVDALATSSWGARVAREQPVVLARAIADGSGRADLGDPARFGEPVRLEVRHLRGAARGMGLGPGRVILGLSGTIRVSGQSTLPAGHVLRLAGSEHQSVVGAEGNFEFEELPSGYWDIVLDRGQSPARLLPMGQMVTGARGLERLDLRSTGTDRLLLDDFEDLDVAWALRGFLPSGGWWWIAADTSRRDLRAIFGAAEAAALIRTVGGARVLDLAVNLDDSSTYASVGLDLGIGSNPLPDLGAATSLAITGTASGNWEVLLHEALPATERIWTAPLPFDSAGAIQPVTLSSFVPDSPTPAATLPGRVRLLSFRTLQSGRLQLDQVSVEGLGLEDWR